MLWAGARSDVGKVRLKNEDAFYIDSARGHFIVADGLGGHPAGEVASALAVDEIRRHLQANEAGSPSLRLLREAVEAGNSVVYQSSMENPGLYGMGTTVVVSLIRKSRLLLAHVGDSRCYLLSSEGLVRLTEDHTVLFEMIKEGLLSEQEAFSHPYRGVLNRSLGLEPHVQVDCRELPYGGEPLLLCTDGLTDMLRDQEIEEILRANPDPQKACDALVQAANEMGGRDNITAVLVKGS